MRIFGFVLLALELAVAPAWAQIQIDKRRPAGKTGEVTIENNFGSVKVIGWEKDEVAVTGQIAAAAEGIDFGGDKESAWVQVASPESWRFASEDDTDYRSNLEIHVPRGSSLEVRTVNASISVEAVDGSVDVETINGPISVAGAPRAVEVNSITGAVEISAGAAEMHIETVAGKVTLRGAARAVSVRSVSGAVEVSGKEFERVELETTAGDIRFEGSFRKEGSFELETFSGQTQLLLPADVAARFRLETFSGQIESEIGPKPRRSEKFNPFQELRFSTGENDFDVSVKTYSGNIVIRLNRGAAPEAGKPPAGKGGAE